MPPKNSDCKKLTQSNCDHCDAQALSVLCNTSEKITEHIDAMKVTCSYKSGQTIFFAGAKPLGLFAVQSGIVKLEVLSPQGAAHTIRLIGPGGVLGYRSLFSGENYHASAVATEEVQLCFLPKAEILGLFSTQPELAMKFLSYMSKDLRQAEEKWVDQMDKEAGERVAEALLFLEQHFNDLDWTRKEIAEWAGTTPETVIRTLSQFEKEGLIDQSNRMIRIANRPALQQKAHANHT